jgi:hypothetical protein
MLIAQCSLLNGQCSFIIALNRHNAVFQHLNEARPAVLLCNFYSRAVQRATGSDCHKQCRGAVEGE